MERLVPHFLDLSFPGLQRLPKKKINPVEVVDRNRQNKSINQYLKSHAKKTLGLYSNKFENNGFSPANPIPFKSNNFFYSSALLARWSFAFKEVKRKETKDLLSKPER